MVSITHRRPRRIEQRREVGGTRRRERPVEAVRSVEHRARSLEAAARHQGGADTGLRRPAGVHALGPRPLGKIFDDAGCHAAGNPDRRCDRSRRQAQRRRNAAGGRERAEYRRRMKARLVRRHRRDEAEPAEKLHAGHDADEQPVAPELLALTGGEHRGNDYRA